MFITTPLVRFVTNRLWQRGMLDQHHRDSLVKYDFHINSFISLLAGVAALAYLVS